MTKYTPYSLFMRQALLYTPTGKKYPSEQEFVDNGDGTISDLSTGLMWPKDSDDAGGNFLTTMTHPDAVAYVASLNFAGYSDWRLPTIRELVTLVNYASYLPCKFNIFDNIANDLYWSATENYLDGGLFWFADFIEGGIYYMAYDSYANILAVRNY